MTFEEFEKANKDELKAAAKHCFDLVNSVQIVNELQVAKLLEAQFYMQELDRRDDSRIARRDFWLEIAVIVLILAEIVLSIYGIRLAIRQGNDDDVLMDKQNKILFNLQTATADTASAMKALTEVTKAMSDATTASGSTLRSLRSTSEKMNEGIHGQIALFYDPSPLMGFDIQAKRLSVANQGRSNLSIRGVKYGSDQPVTLSPAQMVTPNGVWSVSGEATYLDLLKTTDKGKFSRRPVEIYLSNENGKKFVVRGSLIAMWENESFIIHVQQESVTPE